MASVSANGMPSSNATSANATGQASPYVGTSPTVPSTSLMVSNTSDTALTLVTFGPLSACVSIPRLDNTAAPVLSNSTVVAQRQLDAWLGKLPTTTRCTTLAWTLRPDYSDPLDALARFQDQIDQLFPVQNSTFAAKILEAQPAGNASFFQPSSGAGLLLAPSSGPRMLPTTLPIWMGAVMAGVVLVHLVVLLLHIGAEIAVLFPSFAAKSKHPLAQSLPMQNESTATLVEPKTTPEDGKIDPPGYTAPVVQQAVVGSVGDGQLPVARACRSAKRVFVPLLLLAALGMVGIAVVLNSKFAQGPVGVASSALVSTDTASTSASGVSVASSFAVATSSVRRAGHASNATSADSTALPTGTLSMTRLARRQADFFPPAPAPSRSSSSESLAPTWTSTPSTRSSLVAPTPSSSAMFSSFSSPTSTSSLSTQSILPVATTAPVASTAHVSNEARQLLVMERGSSMHRVWWIVMLDLVLWFIQRRRTRSQYALDKAHATLLPRPQ
ncbi:hypothetical protein PANT_11d00042 [Moesziomyces antarcticus T-34]|uniref:Uncharacterized protein n=1 Tax=Pseudozyma antarctica (strain T-34) TaxID=1151754 RepID=M9M2J5_PSEA3|nr:hypothetical protein PANT_11d00042 [Moesziomyces antarcticus T-34]